MSSYQVSVIDVEKTVKDVWGYSSYKCEHTNTFCSATRALQALGVLGLSRPTHQDLGGAVSKQYMYFMSCTEFWTFQVHFH